MSKANRSALLDFAHPDSDSDSSRVSALKTTDKMPAAKKPRGRAAANRVTKTEPKATTRRAAAKVAAAVEKEAKRQALTEKTTNPPAKDTRRRRGNKTKEEEEDDDDDDDVDDVLATPPSSDEPVRKRGGRGRPKKDAIVPDSEKNTVPARRGGRKTAAETTEEEPPRQEGPCEIPETQLDDAMGVDYAEEQDQVEDLPRFSRFSAPPSVQRTKSYNVPPSASKLPGNSSSLESDPSVRRRLGEMSKKYEALELKYRDMRNVAVTEAEKNFDRLKKQSEERAQTAKQLITSLKNDLTAQKQLAKEGQKSQHQLEASEAKVESLQAQVTGMTTSLAEARTEIKALTMRLNAARAAEAAATAATARVPGSAMKPSLMGARGMDGAQVQAAQTAKMKENLYSDLTGLVVTGVRRDGSEDVYDCIQTGRNGTLHFKLAIANENSDENLDEAEFMYKPQLDERRDSALIAMLPDYLVDEITFPRPHAAKFYSRVFKSLTEKLE